MVVTKFHDLTLPTASNAEGAEGTMSNDGVQSSNDGNSGLHFKAEGRGKILANDVAKNKVGV